MPACLALEDPLAVPRGSPSRKSPGVPIIVDNRSLGAPRIDA
jgi:hypothetical protein